MTKTDLPYKSVFVITFRKISQGPENGSERRPSQFSTICAENQVLKLNIDKVTVIRVTQMPLSGDPPCIVLDLACTAVYLDTKFSMYGSSQYYSQCRYGRTVQP